MRQSEEQVHKTHCLMTLYWKRNSAYAQKLHTKL